MLRCHGGEAIECRATIVVHARSTLNLTLRTPFALAKSERHELAFSFMGECIDRLFERKCRECFEVLLGNIQSPFWFALHPLAIVISISE